MLYFPKWLVALIMGICALGVILTIPNLFPQQTVAAWPKWLPKQQVNLGLDLRGGSYLLYQVDMKSVLSERMTKPTAPRFCAATGPAQRIGPDVAP